MLYTIMIIRLVIVIHIANLTGFLNDAPMNLRKLFALPTLGVLPQQWLTAVITPVAKISNPIVITYFRLISVAPILSRVVEKYVVTRWLRPIIPPVLIADQFVFRPTGSTICACIDIAYMMHYVTRMLEHNAYVRCLLIDFCKAFDRVNHVILVKKLSNLQLPSSILNWLISFVSGRSHTTR
jgi:hypothetical protein